MVLGSDFQWAEICGRVMTNFNFEDFEDLEDLEDPNLHHSELTLSTIESLGLLSVNFRDSDNQI